MSIRFFFFLNYYCASRFAVVFLIHVSSTYHPKQSMESKEWKNDLLRRKKQTSILTDKLDSEYDVLEYIQNLRCIYLTVLLFWPEEKNKWKATCEKQQRPCRWMRIYSMILWAPIEILTSNISCRLLSTCTFLLRSWEEAKTCRCSWPSMSLHWLAAISVDVIPSATMTSVYSSNDGVFPTSFNYFPHVLLV